jgi:hypothetical protein
MGYIDDLRTGFGMLLHPSGSSKVNFSSRRALLFYYELTILPLILFAMFAIIVADFGPQSGFGASYTLSNIFEAQILYPPGSIPMILSLFGSLAAANITQNGISVLGLLISVLLTFLVLVPLGLIFEAFVYHLIGKKFLNIWSGSYSKTLSSVILGSMPVILFFWLAPIPLFGILAALVLRTWSIVSLTISISVQQSVERLKSLFVILIELLPLFGIFYFVLLFELGMYSTF